MDLLGPGQYVCSANCEGSRPRPAPPDVLSRGNRRGPWLFVLLIFGISFVLVVVVVIMTLGFPLLTTPPYRPSLPRDQVVIPKQEPPRHYLYVDSDKTPLYEYFPGSYDSQTPPLDPPGKRLNKTPASTAHAGTKVIAVGGNRGGWTQVKLADYSGSVFYIETKKLQDSPPVAPNGRNR
jgi:hypothetical protein